MNVQLVNPTRVLGLFSHGHAAKPRLEPRRAPSWAGRMRARLDEKLRHRRALHELHQLDDRELDDLDLARADLPALVRRHATGVGRPARS